MRVCDDDVIHMLYVPCEGDSLSFHVGMKFSTRDQDNDMYASSCAQLYKGAWWYKVCHRSNLNSQYLNGTTTSFADSVNWYHWKGYYYSLNFVEMKIRPCEKFSYLQIVAYTSVSFTVVHKICRMQVPSS